ETHGLRLGAGLGDGPGGLVEHAAIGAVIACRQLAQCQVLQVVLNIFSRGACHSRLKMLNASDCFSAAAMHLLPCPAPAHSRQTGRAAARASPPRTPAQTAPLSESACPSLPPRTTGRWPGPIARQNNERP